eukprot:7112962-Pyramimonas_sp.AAC.1
MSNGVGGHAQPFETSVLPGGCELRSARHFCGLLRGSAESGATRAYLRPCCSLGYCDVCNCCRYVRWLLGGSTGSGTIRVQPRPRRSQRGY